MVFRKISNGRICHDPGYYRKPSGNYNNDWTGQFTGKDGVYSVKYFLNNSVAQENAQRI